MTSIWIPKPIYKVLPYSSIITGIISFIFLQYLSIFFVGCILIVYGIITASFRISWSSANKTYIKQ